MLFNSPRLLGHNVFFRVSLFLGLILLTLSSSSFTADLFVAGGGGGGSGVGSPPSAGGFGGGGKGGNGEQGQSLLGGGGGGGGYIGDGATPPKAGDGTATSGGAGTGGGNAGGYSGTPFGGDGGQAAYALTADVVMGTIGIYGGDGGTGAEGADAGSGGNAALAAAGIRASTLVVQAGNGGNTKNSSSFGGGNGGNATFASSGAVETTSLSVTSGAKGIEEGGGSIPGPGAGGNAGFSAGSLSASTITLTKQGTTTPVGNPDGSLSFTVGTLNVAQNTAFSMDKGVSTTGTFTVSINGLAFSGGSALNVTRTQGTETFTAFGGALSVRGSGNTLNSPLGFNASGQILSFDLTGVAANSTMLSTTGAGTIDVSGASVSLSGTSMLALNDTVTLVTGVSNSATLGTPQTLGRRVFTLTQAIAGDPITAQVTSLQTFGSVQSGAVGSWSNINLVNGAGYLDWLESGGLGVDPALMGRLEATFDNSLALGGANAAIALEQVYGGYAAYANQSLLLTGSRFRNVWQGHNNLFLDSSAFAGQSPAFTGASAAFATADALASPRYGARDCVPAGQSRIWASGFGTWAKQDSRDNLAGYKYDSQGAALGYEYAFNNCFKLGFAAAYSRGDLKIDNLRYDADADIMNLALYGVYAHPSGIYAQGGLGYGQSWNDYDVNMLLGGTKSGKYNSQDFSADLELGYVAKLPQDFNFIPSVGLEYDYLKNGGWTERITGNPALIANRFDGDHDNSLGIPLGLRFNKLFRFGSNGGYVVPEVRTQWVYQAEKSRPSIASGFAGAPGSSTMYGVDPGRSHWRLGAGLSGRFNEKVDFRVDYDFDTRSGYRGHNVQAALGLSF